MNPWLPALPLSDAAFAHYRRRAIFDCCKWDPQYEDVSTLARTPLLLTRSAWRELVRVAEALARETLAAEAELLARPDLHHRLGLPRAVRKALQRTATEGPPTGVARLIRFDFHWTTDGWRISEANTDVPGGLNEASGLPPLAAPHYPQTEPVGDAAGAYVRALLEGAPPDAHVVLAHATAYSDDHQVMTYLGRLLDAAGAVPILASPAHLRWNHGSATLANGHAGSRVDLVPRFFPGEWLVNLPSGCGWGAFFAGSRTPVSNPAAALLTQTKRFPLAWDDLSVPLTTWRAMLPETRDPRDVPWFRKGNVSEDWVLKPALGRVGEDIGMAGLLSPKDWRRIRWSVRLFPQRWVAQRRFDSPPTLSGDGPRYPCVGVFTVGDRAVGAYGRIASRPLIDGRAEDAPVLMASGEEGDA